MLLHTEACIKINLYTKQLLHTEAFTPRSLLPHFLTFDPHFVGCVGRFNIPILHQSLMFGLHFVLQTNTFVCIFTSAFDVRILFCAKRLPVGTTPSLKKEENMERKRERDTEREEREQREDVKIWRCKIHRCLQYNEDAYLTSFLRKIFAQMLSGKTYSQGCSQHPKCTGWSNGQLERQNHPLPLCGYIYT